MTDFARGPVYPGVCQECGNPTGDDGSLCVRCANEEQARREPEMALEDGPFLPDEE